MHPEKRHAQNTFLAHLMMVCNQTTLFLGQMSLGHDSAEHMCLNRSNIIHPNDFVLSTRNKRQSKWQSVRLTWLE